MSFVLSWAYSAVWNYARRINETKKTKFPFFLNLSFLFTWVIPGTFSPGHGVTVRSSQQKINWYQLHFKRQQQTKRSTWEEEVRRVRDRGVRVGPWVHAPPHNPGSQVDFSMLLLTYDLIKSQSACYMDHEEATHTQTHTHKRTTHPPTPCTVSVNSTCCNGALDKCLVFFPLGPCNRAPPKRLAVTACKKTCVVKRCFGWHRSDPKQEQDDLLAAGTDLNNCFLSSQRKDAWKS